MYETWLIPYLEDTLDAERRRELEARLTDDPRLASELNALRRAEPRLRAVAAHLRRAEATRSEAPRSAPAPLWPGLRGRLDARAARPRFGPAFWWTGGGLCAAGLLVLAVLSGPVLRPETPDRKTAPGHRVPVIVSLPDNAVGTRAAERLRARDQRVAAERRAAGAPPRTLVAALPAPPKTTPTPAAVAVPAAPALPVMRPLRVAKREPDSLLPFPVGPPPAPTHSPPPPSPTRPPPATAQREAPGTAEGGTARAGRSADVAAPPATADTSQAPVSAVSPPPQGPSAFTAARPSSADLRQQLERTLTPPAYGTDAADTRREGLLRAAPPGAAGGELRAELESEAGDTQPAASARLLAALDEDGGDWAGAAVRWRRLVRGPDVVAEDWFRLARAEAHLGHADAARQAYAQALQPGPFPLSAAHRATALQNAPQVPAPLP